MWLIRETRQNIPWVPGASMATVAGGLLFEFMELYVQPWLFLFSVPVVPFFQQFYAGITLWVIFRENEGISEAFDGGVRTRIGLF